MISWPCVEVVTLTMRRGGAKGKVSVSSEVMTRYSNWNGQLEHLPRNSMHSSSLGLNNTSLRTISELCLNKFWRRYSSFVSRQ